mmetsp:Transcript_3880/g.24592  ORF Transcript_3880/g.24592 Transcript_3880/m.24592 type:complete len:214 (+) Transcript_3880:1938-2579(+)
MPCATSALKYTVTGLSAAFTFCSSVRFVSFSSTVSTLLVVPPNPVAWQNSRYSGTEAYVAPTMPTATATKYKALWLACSSFSARVLACLLPRATFASLVVRHKHRIRCMSSTRATASKCHHVHRPRVCRTVHVVKDVPSTTPCCVAPWTKTTMNIDLSAVLGSVSDPTDTTPRPARMQNEATFRDQRVQSHGWMERERDQQSTRRGGPSMPWK